MQIKGQRWTVGVAIVVGWGVAMGMMMAGCGSSEVRDRPSDCRADQYFDESRELCRSCPAAEEPECVPGCGVEVGEDRRGCPILRCEPMCRGCEEGQAWDGEAEACVDAES